MCKDNKNSSIGQIKKRIAAHTLGCKLNYAETSDTLRRLAEQGNEIVDFAEVADVYIINTCTVTAVAEKKCRNAIHQAVALNPNAQVVVMGCYAEVDCDKLAAIPGVTHVLGNDIKHLLPDIVSGNYDTYSAASATSAFKHSNIQTFKHSNIPSSIFVG